MSMSLYVVLALLPSAQDINTSAKQINVPIEIIEPVDLSQQSGYLPMKLSGQNTGVEVYIYSGSEAVDIIPETDRITVSDAYTMEFRWGGDLTEMTLALYTAQILTMKYNGVVFDPESGVFLEPQQLTEGIEMLSNLP